MFKLQSKTMNLKLLEDYRLIDSARNVLINSVTSANATVELTNEAVYINHEFYQIIKKSVTKDALTEFENKREKSADLHLNSLTWCLGPYLSVDKQNMIYIFRSNIKISPIAKKDTKDLSEGSSASDQPTVQIRGIMKPNESTYKIVEVPLLMSNQLSVLHRDDFYREKVEISTFTPDNDIFLKV